MLTVYSKSTELEEVQLLRRHFGEIDFKFIRKNKNNEVEFENQVELSLFNDNAQLELNEMFEIYKVEQELRFNIKEALKDVPNVKRKDSPKKN